MLTYSSSACCARSLRALQRRLIVSGRPSSTCLAFSLVASTRIPFCLSFFLFRHSDTIFTSFSFPGLLQVLLRIALLFLGPSPDIGLRKAVPVASKGASPCFSASLGFFFSLSLSCGESKGSEDACPAQVSTISALAVDLCRPCFSEGAAASHLSSPSGSNNRGRRYVLLRSKHCRTNRHTLLALARIQSETRREQGRSQCQRSS